jgi:hypothetical protein
VSLGCSSTNQDVLSNGDYILDNCQNSGVSSYTINFVGSSGAIQNCNLTLKALRSDAAVVLLMDATQIKNIRIEVTGTTFMTLFIKPSNGITGVIATNLNLKLYLYNIKQIVIEKMRFADSSISFSTGTSNFTIAQSPVRTYPGVLNFDTCDFASSIIDFYQVTFAINRNVSYAYAYSALYFRDVNFGAAAQVTMHASAIFEALDSVVGTQAPDYVAAVQFHTCEFRSGSALSTQSTTLTARGDKSSAFAVLITASMLDGATIRSAATTFTANAAFVAAAIAFRNGTVVTSSAIELYTPKAPSQRLVPQSQRLEPCLSPRSTTRGSVLPALRSTQDLCRS